MKNRTSILEYSILAVVLITLFITSTIKYHALIKQDEIHRKEMDILLIEYNQAHITIVNLEQKLQDCYTAKDTMPASQLNGYYRRIHTTMPEPGSANWFPTHNEWNALSEAEKTAWEENYDKF